MKLEKYLMKLKDIRFKYGITPVGLLLLSQYVEESKRGEVTIMNLVEDSPHASPATAHKYLKALIRQKVLAMQDTTDGRRKLLVKGKKYEELEKFVGSC